MDPNPVEHSVWVIQLLKKEVAIATVWSTRIALCESAQVFINKCRDVSQLSIPEETLSLLWQSLGVCAGDRGYESVRTAAARAVGAFVRWVDAHPDWDAIRSKVKAEIPGMVAAETSSAIQAEYTT